MLQLAEKDLKAAIVSIFKDIKEDICMMNKMMKKPFRNVPAHSGETVRESKTGFGKKFFGTIRYGML